VLTKRGTEVLARVGRVLAPLTDHTTQVKDYTDESPTSGALPGLASPATGWELSATRAVAVARFLVEGARVAPERLSATGHASVRPGGTSYSRPFRLRTRRVELLLSPVPAPVSSARSAAPLPRADTSAPPRATREP
jgi:chemotaxis protein MotB